MSANGHQVGLHVAIPKVFPLPAPRMIGVFRR
jgi:hypothetical protein